MFKRAKNWHDIHSKYQKCSDIHSLYELEVNIYQQIVHQIIWKVLGASYENSRYSVEYKLNSLYHDFDSTFHIATKIISKADLFTLFTIEV